MAFEGSGFGKVILFGEHFVVYGIPGIASGIGNKTIARVEEAGKFEFVDNRPEVPGYKKKKGEEIQRQLKALIRHFNLDLDRKPVKITLSGNLLCSSGVGASAALAASISRALNQMLGLGMDDEKINQAAYIAEEAGAGTPSGIDNTCSVFGGFITFEKNLLGGPNKIERLSVANPVEIVMASTGITQETKVVVDDVRRKKEGNREWFDGICREYREVYNQALGAVRNSDWSSVGMLMDKNQEFLRKMGVSCDELENLIRIAKENGAIGAKLTGTGRGGFIVALTPGAEVQERVVKALEDAGFKTLRTTIG